MARNPIHDLVKLPLGEHFKNLLHLERREIPYLERKPDMVLTFESSARPVPKHESMPRPGMPSGFQPDNVRLAETAMKEWAHKEMAARRVFMPYFGEVKIELVFVYPFTQDLLAEHKRGIPTPMIETPDMENLEKLIYDGLKGWDGLWLDDSQITTVTKTKVYGLHTHWMMRIYLSDPQSDRVFTKKVGQWMKKRDGWYKRSQKDEAYKVARKMYWNALKDVASKEEIRAAQKLMYAALKAKESVPTPQEALLSVRNTQTEM